MYSSESPAPFPTSVTVILDSVRCQGCGACIITCHTRAIRAVGRRLLLDAGKCDGCLECMEVCPVDAFSFRDTSESRRSLEPELDEGGS